MKILFTLTSVCMLLLAGSINKTSAAETPAVDAATGGHEKKKKSFRYESTGNAAGVPSHGSQGVGTTAFFEDFHYPEQVSSLASSTKLMRGSSSTNKDTSTNIDKQRLRKLGMKMCMSSVESCDSTSSGSSRDTSKDTSKSSKDTSKDTSTSTSTTTTTTTTTTTSEDEDECSLEGESCDIALDCCTIEGLVKSCDESNSCTYELEECIPEGVGCTSTEECCSPDIPSLMKTCSGICLFLPAVPEECIPEGVACTLTEECCDPEVPSLMKTCSGMCLFLPAV